MKGYIKIDTIIRSLLAEDGYNTLHYYLPYLQIALNGEKEWRTDYGVEIKTKKLSVKDFRASFPSDMAAWSAVGVNVGDRMVTFLPDNTITLNSDCEEATFFQSIPKAKANYYFNNYDGADDLLHGKLIASRFPGFVRVDYAGGQFIFSEEGSVKDVYLEYIPDESCGPSSHTYVHNVAEELIKTYVRWQLACRNRKFGPESARAQALQNHFLIEKDNVMARISDLDYNSIHHITKKYFTTGLR